VQHRSQLAVDPRQPNLRQVHLIASELVADLAEAGHEVAPVIWIEAFQAGLLGRVSWRDTSGTLVRRAGFMGVVLRGVAVAVGDAIEVSHPPRTRPSARACLSVS
jgi:hypothetical protein